MADENEIVFEYIGDGAFIPGVPGRDLTRAEVEKHGGRLLLKRKPAIYRRVKHPQAEQPVGEPGTGEA